MTMLHVRLTLVEPCKMLSSFSGKPFTQKFFCGGPRIVTSLLSAKNGHIRMQHDTVSFTMIDKGGKKFSLQEKVGVHLLDAARKNGVNLEGACDGVCACATCHVTIDSPHMAKVPSATPDEQDLLGMTAVKATNKLGCCVKLTKDLEGMTVRIPSDS